MANLKLYVAYGSGPCASILMLCKHLKLNVTTIRIDTYRGEHRGAAYRKINPLAKVPTLDDNGFRLGESRAIMTYLINKYCPGTPLYPNDPAKRAKIDEMMYFHLKLFFAAGAMLGGVILRKEFSLDQEKVKQWYDVLNEVELLFDGHTCAVGDNLTIADFVYLPDITYVVDIFNADLTNYPNIKRYIDKLSKELPYYWELNTRPHEIIRLLYEERLGGKLPPARIIN